MECGIELRGCRVSVIGDVEPACMLSVVTCPELWLGSVSLIRLLCSDVSRHKFSHLDFPFTMHLSLRLRELTESPVFFCQDFGKLLQLLGIQATDPRHKLFERAYPSPVTSKDVHLPLVLVGQRPGLSDSERMWHQC